ncbi:MAG: hypothetical protein M3O20_16070 [Acidobacteriota bacterium]|nr:hypothetical protein [Acidobacteriota bacterium]
MRRLPLGGIPKNDPRRNHDAGRLATVFVNVLKDDLCSFEFCGVVFIGLCPKCGDGLDVVGALGVPLLVEVVHAVTVMRPSTRRTTLAGMRRV